MALVGFMYIYTYIHIYLLEQLALELDARHHRGSPLGQRLGG
jgi:hypothetical protein